MQQHIIAIIGGTGKAGTYLVNTLVAQGYKLNMLVRNPSKAASLQHPQINIVIGTVQQPEAIQAVLKDCTAVISTLGLGIPASEPGIFSQSTRNILQAMQHAQLSRYLVITGLNVDTPSDHKGPETAAGTAWMKEHFPSSTADKQLEYSLLAESTADWTMVRLPRIEQTEVLKEISINLEDCPGNSVSASSLAHFLSEQITARNYIRKAPFIADK
ncbi:NmrA-like family protein [compost metagenome]